MSGIGNKLSRHVLGMKFMRKTKEQIDKTSLTPTGSIKSESSLNLKCDVGATEGPSALLVEELWSYNQCERYVFGRQSYGGFNPVVEKNLKKGIWKPFYLEEGGTSQDSSDDEDDNLKKQSDVDVSDEEMAKTYGSIIGTLAKKFKGKRNNRRNKKNSKGNRNDNQVKQEDKKPHYSRDSDEEMESRQNLKRQRESTGSVHMNEDREHRSQRNTNRPSPSKRNNNSPHTNAPLQKRRKFWKPSD